MSVTRRSFLKGTAAVTAMTAAGGNLGKVIAKPAKVVSVATPNKWRGRVAINFNKNAITGSASHLATENDVIQKMVDDAIIKLAEGDSENGSVGAAWKAIFPSTLTAESKIAIKTNFYALNIAPPAAALFAMAKGLRQMDFDGNAFTGGITIYEGNTMNSFVQAGYDAFDFGSSEVDAKLVKESYTASSDPADGESKYSASLEEADFLINVFSARGHNGYAEKVSLGFKSHYGTYATGNMMSMHSSDGFPQRVRNLHCTGVIAKKQVLSVSCAFFCNNEGVDMGSTSPQSFSTYAKTMDPDAACESPCTVIVSTDAVSCEMQAIKLLRLNKGGTYTVDTMPRYLRASAGVDGHGISGPTYDIGEIDEEKMDVRTIINEQGITPVKKRLQAMRRHETAITVSQLHQGITFFEFSVPQRILTGNNSAQFSIFELNGRTVFSRELVLPGSHTHFSWNRKTSSGGSVPSGKYLCTLRNHSINCRTSFVLS